MCVLSYTFVLKLLSIVFIYESFFYFFWRIICVKVNNFQHPLLRIKKKKVIEHFYPATLKIKTKSLKLLIVFDDRENE